MGIWENFLISLTNLKTSSWQHPDSKARWAASWLVSPSAKGSEKGTPSSSISTPFSIKDLQINSEVSKLGSHAQTYPTKAERPFSLQFEKSFAIRSIVSINIQHASILIISTFGNGKACLTVFYTSDFFIPIFISDIFHHSFAVLFKENI